MFSKRRKSGERESRLVKKPELGKNILGENRYEGPEARKIFSNFAEQGGKNGNRSEATASAVDSGTR